MVDWKILDFDDVHPTADLDVILRGVAASRMRNDLATHAGLPPLADR